MIKRKRMLNIIKELFGKEDFFLTKLSIYILLLIVVCIYKFGFFKGIYAGIAVGLIAIFIIPMALVYLVRDKKITINLKSISMFTIFIIWLIIGLYFFSLKSILITIIVGIAFFIVYKVANINI
jgi:hypothetical protein